MKKKKIDVAQDSPFIANWVETNEDKLGELQQVNPDLFTAVQSALNYLNNYLGGSAPIKIEPKAPVQPTVSVSGAQKPYALPFYQWRLRTLEEFEQNGVNIIDGAFKRSFAKIQGQPLVALTDDFEGIQKITIYENQTSPPNGFKDIDIQLGRGDLTLDPIYPDDSISDTYGLIYIRELVDYCNDKITDAFNGLYSNLMQFEYVCKEVAEEQRTKGWTSLSDDQLYYLYERSPKGFWIYQGLRVVKSRQDFEDYQFIDEFGTVYTTISVAFNALEKEIALTIFDGKKKEMIVLSLLNATKAFLGLSFIASGVINNIDGDIRFQAVKLKDYRPLPFIIGDRVALVQNFGMSANVGAEALVKSVDLWQSSYQDPESPKGLATNLEVEWQDKNSKKQSNGGYNIQVFKNLSRPQAINSVPTAQTKQQTNEPNVWRVKTEAEFLADFGIDWRASVTWTADDAKDWLFGKPLVDILQDDDIARIPKNNISELSTSDALYTKSGLDPIDKSRAYGLDADDLTNAPLPKANVWRVKTEAEFEAEYGATWRDLQIWSFDQDWLFGKPLLEVIVPDEFGLIPVKNAKELTTVLTTRIDLDPNREKYYLAVGDITDAPLPIPKANVWRVKTEAEFQAEYGLNWRSNVAWSSDNQKDILFGKKLEDILDDDSLSKMPTTKNLPDYEYVATKDEFGSYGLNNEDITDAPLPITTSTPSSIDIVDVMKFTSWSSGLQQSMIQDFVQSGYKFVDKLIGATKEETSKNIQKKANGFSSGKNTYLQANMLAEIIQDFAQKQNTVNVQPSGIVWRVKTEAEYLAEYGKDWKEVVSWFDDGTKEWLFGRNLLEVIDEDSLVNVPKTKAELIGMGTVYTLASVSPNGDVQGLDGFDLTDAPLPSITTKGNQGFDVMRKEAYKFRASTPEESWAFQEYVFSKGVKRIKNISLPKQIIDDEASDFMVENGILLTLSLYSFNSSKAEQVYLSTLGIKVEDYPKPAPVKKTPKKTTRPKVQATPTVKKPDVQNLYNELDDLDI